MCGHRAQNLASVAVAGAVYNHCWQAVDLERLYNVGCNSTGRQILLGGIKMTFSAKKVSPVVHSSSPFQQSSPVIIDSL